MKQFYYAYRQIIREKSSSIIKITSLTLGILVGIQIFARIAFELNYDNFYHNPENLYLIRSSYSINGVEEEDSDRYIYAPIPAALKENFPDEVQSASIIRQFGDDVFYYDGHRFSDIQMLYTDQYLLETLGIDVLQGNTEDLANVDIVFISESFAKKIDSNLDVIGKILYIYKSYPVTVKGVFKDIPENTEFRFDLISSFSTYNKRADGRRGGWGYDISYTGFVRFNNSADVLNVQQRLPEMLKKYMPDYDESSEKFWFQPLGNYHASKASVKEMILIVSILGVAILLISVMNYVLISISSLPIRAKRVGIFRCNGATSADIMKMFIWETAILMLVSVLLAIFFMYNLRGIIEDKMNLTLSSLFAPHNLLLPALVIIVIFIAGAILPGKLFSRLSVSQTFKRYTEKKSSWKKILLFIQFAGVTFVLGIVILVFFQYKAITEKDLGYNLENIVTCYHYFPDPENAKTTIRNISMVEDVATSSHNIIDGYSGEDVMQNDVALFGARVCWIDYDYVPFMGITIKEGRNVRTKNELLVNEELVKRMPWSDSPIGKQIESRRNVYGTVVGVVKDFPIRSFYGPLEPVIMIATDGARGTYSVKLKEPFDRNVEAFNKTIAEIYPTDDILFTSLEKDIDRLYTDTRNFRDLVSMIFVSVFMITIIGLIGYINDEIRRRSKEVAIRKVNGAGIFEILSLLVEDIIWVALPSVITGIILAYFVGEQWLNQFQGYHITIGIPLLIFIAILMLLIIGGIVILKAWKLAKSNPVDSIKNE